METVRELLVRMVMGSVGYFLLRYTLKWLIHFSGYKISTSNMKVVVAIKTKLGARFKIKEQEQIEDQAPPQLKKFKELLNYSVYDVFNILLINDVAISSYFMKPFQIKWMVFVATPTYLMIVVMVVFVALIIYIGVIKDKAAQHASREGYGGLVRYDPEQLKWESFTDVDHWVYQWNRDFLVTVYVITAVIYMFFFPGAGLGHI